MTSDIREKDEAGDEMGTGLAANVTMGHYCYAGVYGIQAGTPWLAEADVVHRYGSQLAL